VESLKVLQTILLLVTTTEIVSGQHLAKVYVSITTVIHICLQVLILRELLLHSYSSFNFLKYWDIGAHTVMQHRK